MKLLFPGSFDPFTIGHAELVERALQIAQEVVIAIGINESKHSMFNREQRLNAIKEYYKSNPRISVIEYKGLTVQAVRDSGANAILRAARSTVDFEIERNMADINRTLDNIETIMLVASPSLQHVSSSLVRELINFGSDVSELIIDTFKPYINTER